MRIIPSQPSLQSNDKSWWAFLALAALLMCPVLAVTAYSYFTMKKELTQMTFYRREAVADLTVKALKERLDHVVDVGNALAVRGQLLQFIKKKRWDMAVATLSDVPREYPYIKRVFLTNQAGLFMGGVPPLRGTIGKDQIPRDWYRDAGHKREPYISEVYRAASPPGYNMISEAFPLKNDDGNVLGVLVIQVQLEKLLDWAKDVKSGPFELIYFTDRRGRLIASSQPFPHASPLADFSRIPPVQKALQGAYGLDVSFNPIRRTKTVSAYASVPDYGWVVVVSQPLWAAVEERDAALASIKHIYMAFIVLTGFFCVVIITFMIQRKRRGEELFQRTMALARSNAEKEQLEAFAAVASHNLQTPLTKIIGSCVLLRNHCAQAFNQEGMSHLEQIMDVAKRASQFLESLVTFVRIATQPQQLESVDLEEVVGDVIADMEDQITASEARIEIGNLPRVRADRALMKELFRNLISNAVQFRKKNGIPLIKIYSLGIVNDNAQITVEDNGIGFDEKYSDAIFHPFERLHALNASEGRGLGLAICRKIVLRHNGGIVARSTPGQGSAFIVTLPALSPTSAGVQAGQPFLKV